MNSELQIALLDELVALQVDKQPFLDAQWVKAGVDRYFDPAHFADELAVFRAQPRIVLHSSELAEPGAYRTMQLSGRPLLIVRGEDRRVRAFFNVCRHRGAELVGDGEGCSKRFSCPYHAWTWNNEGQLVGVPHEKTGFPDLDRSELGLREIGCAEHAGWIWVSQQSDDEPDLEAHLDGLHDELGGLDADGMAIYQSETFEFDANWKLIVEGGIEAYHFRVAHKDTIAPLFLDNLSSYQCFGPHLRSVLPRSNLAELQEMTRETWDIGVYANVIYTIFPTTQFLVQEDHIAWIHLEPLAADRTQLRLSTVVPASELTPERERHWRLNHDLTVRTLSEDFAIGAGIQRGLQSGANTHLNYGRFEGALDKFNRSVDAAIAAIQ